MGGTAAGARAGRRPPAPAARGTGRSAVGPVSWPVPRYPEHPLALFLDDLQWLDAATLEVVGDLLVESEPRHLLLVGAYRDNEVDAAHPLMRKISALRNGSATVREIVLGPLGQGDLARWVADALHCDDSGRCLVDLP